MAWRPYQNLIDGELDNRIAGKVTGWMRFYRRGKKPFRVTFDLAGDFHEDIRGKVIRLSNPSPSDRNIELERKGTYMEGFVRMQAGSAGDITAGIPLKPWTPELAQKLLAQQEALWEMNGVAEPEREEYRREFAARNADRIASGEPYYAYTPYPYIEWYSDNGRVVLELDPSQLEVIGEDRQPPREKSPEELAQDDQRRAKAMDTFMANMVKEVSEENRRKGGDGNVSGFVVG